MSRTFADVSKLRGSLLRQDRSLNPGPELLIIAGTQGERGSASRHRAGHFKQIQLGGLGGMLSMHCLLTWAPERGLLEGARLAGERLRFKENRTRGYERPQLGPLSRNEGAEGLIDRMTSLWIQWPRDHSVG